jgi:tetratricopeptide (TPR) repeat protein
MIAAYLRPMLFSFVVAALIASSPFLSGPDARGQAKSAGADSAAKAEPPAPKSAHDHSHDSAAGHSHSAPADTTPESPEEKAKKQKEADERSVGFEKSQREHVTVTALEKHIDSLLAQTEKSPNDFALRFKLANAYQEGAYPHSAFAQYNEAVRIDSTQSKVWVNRGVVLKDLGRLEESEDSFRRALALNQDDALAYINLGDLLLTQKKYQEAVDCHRRAIKLDPKSPNAYYSIAIAFAEAGMYRDAARAWRKSAELSKARGEPFDKANAERAIENAKLMEDIVNDAVKEQQARQEKQREVDQAGAKEPVEKKDAGKESGTTKPEQKGSGTKDPEKSGG